MNSGMETMIAGVTLKIRLQQHLGLLVLVGNMEN